MSVLADDEGLREGNELPAGLRFHLSRCAPCRELAAKLTAVTDGLMGLARREMPDELDVRAESRVLAALREGPAAWNPSEDETDLKDILRPRPFWGLRWVRPGVGIAAVIALSLGAYFALSAQFTRERLDATPIEITWASSTRQNREMRQGSEFVLPGLVNSSPPNGPEVMGPPAGAALVLNGVLQSHPYFGAGQSAGSHDTPAAKISVDPPSELDLSLSFDNSTRVLSTPFGSGRP